MTRLEVCEGKVHSFLCKGQGPGICQLQGTSHSREEPGKRVQIGWRESREEVPWPSLAPAGIPRPSATRKHGWILFIKANELWASWMEQEQKRLWIHRLAPSQTAVQRRPTGMLCSLGTWQTLATVGARKVTRGQSCSRADGPSSRFPSAAASHSRATGGATAASRARVSRHVWSLYSSSKESQL